MAFNSRLGTGFFGGEVSFSNNEVIRIDTGCVVAFEEGIEFNSERAGNLRSMLFGGEGLFLATLRGTGTVWIQSLPLSRLADRIISSAPSIGGTARDEGSALGAFGRM